MVEFAGKFLAVIVGLYFLEAIIQGNLVAAFLILLGIGALILMALGIVFLAFLIRQKFIT